MTEDKYCILMYHRVLIPTETIQAGMYVKPETFERHLFLLKKYFELIPLREITTEAHASIKRTKPICILTFDDGWKDFYDFAFPLIKKYQVPATVFLPTEFIGTDKRFWTDRFANFLLHHKGTINNSEFSDLIHKIDKLQGRFEDRLEKSIELLKTYSLGIIEAFLDELEKTYPESMLSKGRDFLNWSEIHEMFNSGLISFGSHTANHQILTILDKPEIEKELYASKEKLLDQGVVEPSFIPFCYPNGTYTQEFAGMVCSAGYHVAVTTKKGWNQFDTDMFTLNRISIHQDMTSTVPLFACRIAGFI